MKEVYEVEVYPEDGGEVVYRTRSGRNVKRPRRLIVFNECLDDTSSDNGSDGNDDESSDDDDKGRVVVKKVCVTETTLYPNGCDDEDDEDDDSDDDGSDLSFIVPDGEGEETYSTDGDKEAHNLCPYVETTSCSDTDSDDQEGDWRASGGDDSSTEREDDRT